MSHALMPARPLTGSHGRVPLTSHHQRQTITPEGQMLQDAFPRIDAATPVDDLIAEGGVHTWEFAELDVDRILAL